MLDEMAGTSLAERRPIVFDSLQDWTQRSAAEHSVNELLAMIAAHPAVAAIELGGFRLIDFAEYRLRLEVAWFLRGWTVASLGTGAGELICDPALAPALAIGALAGMGLDPRDVTYVLPPALAGSGRRRAVAHQLTRVISMASSVRRVRVAVVAAGKLSLALAALPDADLRTAGVGLMPFPGLDHGNGLLLALRRRRPLLGAYGPRRMGTGAAVELPERLDLTDDVRLDRALTGLVREVLGAAAPELAQAVRALEGLSSARALRAVLLPSAAYGASRLLIDWAHRRGLRVGAIQHGIYSFREFDGGDRRADVILGWGAGTIEQVQCWPRPRPMVHPIGVPGLPAATRSRRASSVRALRRALIATSNTVDTPIAPVGFCEAFLDMLIPGVERLVSAGVEVLLRPHPSEEPERYRWLLSARGLNVRLAPAGPFAAALDATDILISSTSSVAFEAASLGVPVLLWLGPLPRWVRAQRHLLAPWIECVPGTLKTPPICVCCWIGSSTTQPRDSRLYTSSGAALLAMPSHSIPLALRPLSTSWDPESCASPSRSSWIGPCRHLPAAWLISPRRLTSAGSASPSSVGSIAQRADRLPVPPRSCRQMRQASGSEAPGAG